MRIPVAFTLVFLSLVSSALADAKKPVKVFILAGQSNMVGHGKTWDGLNPEYDPRQPQSATNRREIPGGIGGLAWAVKTMPETFGPNGTDPLVDGDGEWLLRDDVSVYSRIEVFKDKKNPGQLTEGHIQKGRHTVGFGKGRWNGPEYGFGHIVGNALEQDVLIIKVATGGTSLQVDWRSPTAVAKRGGEVGYMWTHMLRTVKHVLDNLGTEFPEYTGRDYEIAGFGEKSTVNHLGKWHSEVGSDEFFRAIRDHTKNELWLKVQPPIIHVACDDLESANNLLKISYNSGFKYSSIKSTSPFLVEITSSEHMELPLGKDGKILVDDNYLTYLHNISNQKLKKSQSKIYRLIKNLKQ